MYRNNTASVLSAAGYDPTNDFAVSKSEGNISLDWTNTDPQPTEQQINAYADDSTALPSGQLFSAWLEENGGNKAKTERRLAREFQEDQNAQNRALRATMAVLVQEINDLRAWTRNVRRMAENSATPIAWQTKVATMDALERRPRSEVKDAINTLIDGE